jgi:small-conductance mechanosensitive channel
MDLNKLVKEMGAGHMLDARLFEIGGTSITIATLVTFTLIVLVTIIISWVIQRGTTRALAVRGVKDEGSVGVARRLVHYLVMAIGLGIGLQTMGIDISALFAAGAVFAIGLGFAMQNIAQNFVSGVILLLERAIKPGDVLRVEGQLVKVTKMAIRATHARTLDDEEIIVPNSAIVQSTVTNYTLRDSLYRLRCPVGVRYDSDMRVVRQTLEKVASEVPWRLKEKEPVVLLTEFGSSSVDFEVSVWIDDPWTARRMKSALFESIWWALEEAGVVIAFPQLDVHFDPPVNESIQSLRKAS